MSTTPQTGWVITLHTADPGRDLNTHLAYGTGLPQPYVPGQPTVFVIPNSASA